MDRIATNIICAFIPSKIVKRKVRAYFGQKKLSPLRFFANFFLPKILEKELHNAIVFELNYGLSDQIRTICFAKYVYDNWQGKKPDFLINIGKIFNSDKIGFTPRGFDDLELQNLIKSKERSYCASGKKLMSKAFELRDYKMDWSWITGFVILPNSCISKYDLFGRHYVIYKTQTEKCPFFNGKKIGIPVYVRSFPYFDLFQSPVAIRFLKSMTVELTGENADKLNEIKNTANSICVHIRRGDYIAHKKGLTLSSAYFKKAVAKIIKKTKWKDVTLYVFSDDWDWAKKAININISGVDIKTDFVQINKISSPIPELELMRACKHFVISVGNFAHMAADMSDNPNKILIIPSVSDFVKEQNNKIL